MKCILFALSLLVIMACVGCVKKAACTTPQVAEVSTKLSEALTDYVNEQSVANCLAYKTALTDYLEVVDDCSFVSDQEVADARKELDDLTCN